LLDARNHGDSEHRPTNTIPEMALDLLAFIDKHNLDNIFLMGHR
jgi:pimeloyl-ACP methyl ester carboxylesterase